MSMPKTASKPATKELGKKATKLVASRRPLRTWEFTLVYPGYLQDFSDSDIDALYEAGCADATIGSSEGRISIDFGRSAPSFTSALLSAIYDVEKAGLGLELIRVEPIDD
jgi:hypothetical protein